MSHIVKATELKLLAKFHDDWSKQSVSNATSPNYTNYEMTHALRADVSKYRPEVYKSENSEILKKNSQSSTR